MNKAFEFNFTPFEVKSHIKIGNITIQNDKRFNWFHRLMFKLVFGIIIENVDRGEDK